MTLRELCRWCDAVAEAAGESIEVCVAVDGLRDVVVPVLAARLRVDQRDGTIRMVLETTLRERRYG